MHTSSSRTVLDDVSASLVAAAQAVIPWFHDQLPDAYFHDIDAETRHLHMTAVVGARATGVQPSVTLTSNDGATISVLRPDDRAGLLAEVLRSLPDDRPLHAARIYTARDASLVLDVFRFGEPDRFDATNPHQLAKLDAVQAWAAEHEPTLDPARLTHYLRHCAAVFVNVLSPRRLVRYAALHELVAGTAGVAVDAWDHADDPCTTTLTLAVGEHDARTLFERVATRLGELGLSVSRAYLDPLVSPHGSVTLCAFVVRGTVPHLTSSPHWAPLREELQRIPWLDDRVLACASCHPGVRLVEAEILVALLDLVHVRLCRRDPFAFSRERLSTLVTPVLPEALHLVRRLLGLTQGEPAPRAARLGADAWTLLAELMGTTTAIRGHNLDRPGRYGLMLDLDPAWLCGPEHTTQPHAVVFGRGIHYRGFHIRFRSIARGGLRAVLPAVHDQHTHETERLFDEVYGLAWAQELKNKDIPEGGAKGVVLVAPQGSVDMAVKGFVDGLLDLATGRVPHLLYLGPDERITVPLITWIAHRAAARGYPQPLAFISSKPGAGINHKTYGVTSEGVAVFVEEALRARGHNPDTTPFTVKLTGGPDGDVAGNLIRILHRDHGDRVRFVGIADGSGCAEDPACLDIHELLRLVGAELPIAAFDPSCLKPQGRVTPLSAPDGPHLRDTLCFRVPADVFVPAGGRPRTMNDDNWRTFLDASQRPTSGVVVEGANLFLTPEARTGLSRAGATVFKDSSANKCGVICSSYEIAACMLLDEPGFLAIKTAYVADVVQRLRALARAEARVLLQAASRLPSVPLPELSVRLSQVILKTTDAIASALVHHPAHDRTQLTALVLGHLPQALVDHLGPSLVDDLPDAYVSQTIACVAATRMAYREGLVWLEGRDDAELAALGFRYLEAERDVLTLATSLEEAGQDRAAALLRKGGVLAALG